jgi:GNAT superfamily N-acetyltransferase
VTTARPATRVDADAVASCLGAAFAQDPVWTWAVGAKASRVVRAITAVGATQEPEHFTMTDGGTAVAWWHPPGQWKMSPRDILRLLPKVLPISPVGGVQLLRLSAAIDKVHPSEPHFYLGYLGARPEAQGQGHGAVALSLGLQQADDAGVPCYLESSNPRNLSFYRRHGFVDRPLMPLPKGCPTITPMWREPR